VTKKVELLFTSVEDTFLGISLTEREWPTMRRLSTEIRSVENLKEMRDTLDVLIKAIESRPVERCDDCAGAGEILQDF